MRLTARAAGTLAAAGAVLLPLASPAMACPDDDHEGKGQHGEWHHAGWWHDGEDGHGEDGHGKGDKGDHHDRKHVVTGPTYVYDPYFKKVDTEVVTEFRERGTVVHLEVRDMPRKYWGRTMGAHVHENECGPNPKAAGDHYQNPDTGKRTPLREKEIWLDFKVEKGGEGHAKARVPWRVDNKDARSVIVHEHRTERKTGDAGRRLICTDAVFF